MIKHQFHSEIFPLMHFEQEYHMGCFEFDQLKHLHTLTVIL